MKLKINDEYVDVGFWSFMKCNILTTLVFNLILWGGLLIAFFLIGVFIA